MKKNSYKNKITIQYKNANNKSKEAAAAAAADVRSRGRGFGKTIKKKHLYISKIK